MTIRRAEPADLPQIMEIIGHAQQFLAEQNIDQWQNGYPPIEGVKKDIRNRECYVVENETQQIVATTVFIMGKEPTYQTILGNWLTPKGTKYGVIHRLAIHQDFRRLGIAIFVLVTFENVLQKQQCKSMRIDTHRDNTGMQQLLKRLGYSYCGVIFLEDGSERLAFEKVVN